MRIKLQKILLKMSRYAIYTLIAQVSFYSFAVPVGTEAQNRKLEEISLTLKLKNASLLKAFSRIQNKTDFNFAYKSGQLPGASSINISGEKRSLYDLLTIISSQSGVGFKRVNKTIHVTTLQTGQAVWESEVAEQQFEVTGKVTDEFDNPLPGATILEKGTNNGTVTDADGVFTLVVANENAVLSFSFVGYQPLEIPLNARAYVEAKMAPEVGSLEEVVVIGYGTQRKRDVTGAISSIKTENVQRAVTTSAEELLQGRVSGVTVSQSSNAPGGGITVRVRGTGSISGGNDPLYVIDGIPIANSDQQNNTASDLRFAGSNPPLSPLSMINPQDIESIEVLKDASATAIYGARGANGVVLISTKKGRSGKGTMEWSSSYGFQEATGLPDLLNARQFMELNNEARANSGRSVVFTDDLLNNPPNDTDWQDELYRTAIVQNHNLSARGGNEATLYSLSFGYFDQDGVMVGTNLKRYSARLNLEHKVSNWFKVGINSNFSRTVQDNTITEGGNAVTRTVNEMVPMGPVRIGDEWFENRDMLVEDFVFGLEEANVTPRFNPLFLSEAVTNEAINDRVLGSIFGEITFNENLNFRSTVGADIVNGRLFYFTPSTPVSNNSALTQYSNSTHLSIQNQLTYQKRFGQHNLSATLVQSAEQFNFDRIEVLAEEINDATENFNFDTDTRELNDKFPAADNWSIASFLGRINYDYSGKYLLTASFRYDGSSRFGDDNRWGFFPAVSMGWNIAEESFFDVPTLTSLKLRAGWGVNGSQDIDPFLYESLIRGTRAVMGGQLFPGVEPANIANSDLGWESTRQINVGIDAGFLDERFTLSANIYDKLTSDLLFRTDIPFTSGHPNIVQNIGEVSNRGWEVEIGGTILEGTFTWESSFNYSRNENSIEALDGQVDELIQDNRILREGLSLQTHFAYQTDGLWQLADESTIAEGPQPGAQPGDRRYIDVNNDNTINGDDRVPMGSSIPISTFGFNNTFRHKGLELNIFIQGLGGMEKFNELMAAVENTTGGENASTRVLNRWTPENPDTQVQRAFQAGRQSVPPSSTRNAYYIEDASFIRLKNVVLAYNFPTEMVSRVGLSSARLSFSGQNLATLTDFTIADPEAGSQQEAYPLVRTFTIGLNIGF